MASEHLSDRKLKTYPNPETREEINDDHLIENGKLKKKGVKGLVLRITPTGAKSFAYRYWYNGKTKRYTIGTYPDWSLSEAREKARELSKIVSEGKDPARLKQDEKASNPDTLAEYIERFKKDHVERMLKPSTQKSYKARLNKVQVSPLGKMYLIDIERKDVRRFLKDEHEKYPTNTNRLHSILSKLFNEAIEDGIISSNPIKGMNKLATENVRDPRYKANDLKEIWEAIESEGIVLSGLLKMLMITGQRAGETSRMKWEHIHGDTWTIPHAETKTNQTHDVPLSSLALEVLEDMKVINSSSEYVFASEKDNTKPRTYMKGAINRIRLSTGLSGFIVHDLRHIVATNMIDLEIDFIHVGRVLNHKGLSGGQLVTARYVNTDLIKQKRRAIEKWDAELRRIITGESATILKIGS